MKTLIRCQLILLGILIWAAALLVIPPLSFDPFEYPKALFFIIIAGLLSVLTLIHWIYSNTHFSIKNLPLEIKLLGVIIIAELLAFIFSVNRSNSLIGAPYRFQGLIAELTIVIYFLNVVYVFSKITEKTQRHFFAWVIGSAIIAALLAFIPYFIDIPIFDLANFQNRLYGTLGNPNYLGVFLAGIIPFFGLCFDFKSKIVRVGMLIGLIPVVASLFLTGSRSAWIALIFGLLIASVLVILKKRKYKMLVIVLAVVFVAAGIFTFQKYYDTQIFHRFSMSQGNTGSVMTRLYLQRAGFNLFLEHPIFGSGQETIVGRIEPYLPEYLKTNDIFYIDRTHNEFLDILIMQGLFGFLAYISFWGVLLWKAIRRYLNMRSSDAVREKILLFAITSTIAIHAYYAMNFATISGNILLYLFAGYLVAVKTKNYQQSP